MSRGSRASEVVPRLRRAHRSPEHGGVSRQPLYLFLSAVAWVGFIAVTLWTVLFLAGGVIPRTVDGPPRTNAAAAITVDLALLLAVRRTALGDGAPQVKAWLRRRIPAPLERTSYVLATDICLVLLLVLWQPWGGQVWHVQGTASLVLWSLCAAGWLLAIAATFAVDHLELTGLRQAGWAAPREAPRSNELEVGGLHAIVRHPLMTGLLLAFWATPQMGASHVLFAARRDRVHRHRNQVRGARPTAHVRRRVRRLRRARPGPAAQAPFSDQTSAISAEADDKGGQSSTDCLPELGDYPRNSRQRVSPSHVSARPGSQSRTTVSRWKSSGLRSAL